MKAVLIRTLKKRDRKEVRRIPLPDFLIQQLMKESAGHTEQKLWRFSRTTAWRTVKAVMKGAEVSGIHATAKGLRHGFGVRGAMGRIPLNVIQHWMGHADATTTAIYLAVQDDEERALIEKTW